jgi:hypothetical protein
VGLLSLAAAARGLDPIAILSPSDVPVGYTNGFGRSVDISGDWLVVGAPFDPWYNGDETGAVYVFRRAGARWIEHQKLLGFGNFGDGFGAPVAIDGDWIVIGAPRPSTFCCTTGRVQVLRRDEAGTPAELDDDLWVVVTTLNPDFEMSPHFGASADIDDDLIVVGAPGGEFDPGRAYVFKWNGDEWTGLQTIVPSGTEPGDQFGDRVAVSGGVVAVSAPRETYACPAFGQCQGSAYVFRREGVTWMEEAKLFSSTTPGMGGFVSAYDTKIAAGGWGVVHIFRYTLMDWTQEAILESGDPFAQGFGLSVALADDTIVVGAPNDYEQGNHTGAAYVFRRESGAWIKENKLSANDLTPSSSLGRRVALDGDWAVVGPWGGRAYVYRVCNGCGTLREFAEFQNCFQNTPGLPANCGRLDFAMDAVVDLRDFAQLADLLVGP